MKTIDTAPLSWIFPEVRTVASEAQEALGKYRAQRNDSGSLALAINRVHQFHGALQMLDIEGLSTLSEAVESLLAQFEAEPDHATPAALDAVDDSLTAIVAYCEELLAGGAHEPLRLFPYLRDVLSARNAERVHAADLFFPDLSARILPAESAALDEATVQPTLKAARRRYELSLLQLLQDQATPATWKEMAAALATVAQTQRSPQHHTFWTVLTALAAARETAPGAERDLNLKRLAARVNLQVKRLVDGSPQVAERLMKDALFYVAKAPAATPIVAQVQQVFSLEEAVPRDYETSRFVRIDRDILASAKEKVAQIKGIWNQAAGSRDAEPGGLAARGQFETLEQFSRQAKDLGGLLERLRQASAESLAAVMGATAMRCAADGRVPDDVLGLEVASGILYLELLLGSIHSPDPRRDERIAALIRRIEAAAGGQDPGPMETWLNEIARREQDRSTFQSLTTELSAQLGAVEKNLDQYFRNPADKSPLNGNDSPLAQVEGALGVLGMPEAAKAVASIRNTLREFTLPEAEPSESDFTRLAENYGRLTLAVEAFLRDPEGNRDRYVFDAASQGLVERAEDTASASREATSVLVAEPIAPAMAELSLVEPEESLEQVIQGHQKKTVELIGALQESPQDESIKAELRDSLIAMRDGAAIIDEPSLVSHTSKALAALSPSGDVSALTTLAQALDETPSATAPQPLQPVPESEEAIDAELLGIFIEEAREVLDTIGAAIPQAEASPSDQGVLTTLRRGFHTLKGSGRMVGLDNLGEASWAIEQLMNHWLAEGMAATPELLRLITTSAHELRAWVDEIDSTGRSWRKPEAFQTAAVALRNEGVYRWTGASEAAVPLAQTVEATEHILPTLDLTLDLPGAESSPTDTSEPALETAEAVDVPLAPDFDLSLPDLDLPQSVPASAADAPLDLALDLDLDLGEPVSAAPVSVVDLPLEPSSQGEAVVPAELDAAAAEDVKQIGPVTISVPLFNIYTAEADENLRRLSQDFAEWSHEQERPVSELALRLAHTLAGSAATVGARTIQTVAGQLEDLLLVAKRTQRTFDSAGHAALETIAGELVAMQRSFASGEYPPVSTLAVALLDGLAHVDEVDLPGPVSDVALEAPVIESAAVIDLADSAQAGEIDLLLGDDIVAEAPSEPAELLEPVDALESIDPPMALPVDVLPAIEEPPVVVESEALPVTEPIPVSAPAIEASPPAAERPAIPVTEVRGPVAAVDMALLPDVGIRDEIEPELFEIFSLEAHEQFPQLSDGLRAWRAQPTAEQHPASLLRTLHTLKGSARMAGALRVGQSAHEMETRIEHAVASGDHGDELFDELERRNDRMQLVFEVTSGNRPEADLLADAERAEQDAATVAAPVEPPAAASEVQSAAANVINFPVRAPAAPVTAPATPPATAAAAEAGGALVRVRADILDRLVNQAGEVAIARTRVEAEVVGIRNALGELTENVSRLRTQLRELEIQAESQIESRLEQQRLDAGFDPLEFDRFTRLQELTRLIAESVNDVQTVQQNLGRSLVEADRDLLNQARLTRDLTQDLMRVRMVPFDSVSNRLYRVVRQAGRDTGKRVALDIRGAGNEVDRAVLERMVGPFEHLLRNAVAHGVESAERRVASGKSEQGNIQVDVRQEGNEIRITFSDDGAGLNLPRIRERGVERGLLAADASVSDTELTELIFQPGFSTATELTELAGRGVGMDVVRAETASLGGRISVSTDAGKGTQFTIFLPLTLAVTQVVLVRVGSHTVALPAVLVSEVQQLKAAALAAAYNEGQVLSRGKPVAMHYLAQLMALDDATPAAQRYSPVVVLAQGDERTAIHVDEVIGTREVVVKNIGPQLARVIGISGATVLGSGEVVLIINPLPMAQRFGHAATAPHPSAPQDAVVGGAVAEIVGGRAAASEPSQGLRTLPVVMVVDDSLTVRRVTQRLLSREGFQVVLAKDGVDALRQLQDVTPDVMLVDIEMPRMDGFDLTRNVRGDARYTELPIIMITSRTADKHRNFAMELGVNVFLGKPYQDNELLGHIRGFLGSKAPQPA
jgi:chemosensory pili system protein ChpA (sensor histidine kinase/response regulator)